MSVCTVYVYICENKDNVGICESMEDVFVRTFVNIQYVCVFPGI